MFVYEAWTRLREKCSVKSFVAMTCDQIGLLYLKNKKENAGLVGLFLFG